ncbi:MAG: hypothetical protein ACSLE0_15310 [Chitinophagaceae bacterium]
MNSKIILSITAAIYFSVTAIQPHTILNSDKPVKDPITKKVSTYSSRNNHAVKIYPDVLKRTMHVVAKENDGMTIDFFVFDLQGTLMVHYKMEEGDHEKLTGLQRGNYVYHVFCGDEETAIGKFNIR